MLFNGTALDQAGHDALTELVVEENTDAASIASLRFTLTQDSNGIWTYLDDPRFAPLNQVTVMLGFSDGLGALGAAIGSLLGGGGSSDGLVRIFDGYITHVETDFAGSGGPALTVRAMDSSVLLSFEDNVAVWPDCSDSDIVSSILGTYGLTADTEPTATTHDETVTTVVQRATDLAFIRRLAQRNGYEFYFDSSDDGTVTGHFKPPNLDGTPQKDLALLFGDDTNLRSFATRLTTQRPLAVKVSQIDVDEASANIGTATDTQLTKLGASDQSVLVAGPLGSLVTPSEALAQMRVLGQPTADAGELQTIAQAVRDEAAWFITATGEINTDAYATVLRAHQTVLIKGVGSTYSGTYYVTRVVHDLKGDGSWAQRFEARRNARDVTGSEPFGGNSGGLSLPGL